MAHTFVFFISTKFELWTFGNNFTIFYSGVYYCFISALTNRLDFGNTVSYFEKTLTAREKVCSKIGSKTEAKDGNIVIINYTSQLCYLLHG